MRTNVAEILQFCKYKDCINANIKWLYTNKHLTISAVDLQKIFAIIPMKINETIRKMRQVRGYTQENVADSIGVDITTIVRYEKDGTTIPSDKLEAISKALGLASSDLYKLTEEPSLLADAQTPYERKQTNTAQASEIDNVLKLAKELSQKIGNGSNFQEYLSLAANISLTNSIQKLSKIVESRPA
jgi:transcriptional regulator with XRE-family HTH domain